MATTIHSLAYKITADSAGFTKGVAATRKELSSAKRIMRDTEAPIERYQRNVKDADRLLQKGVITQKQYNRHVGMLKDKLNATRGPLSSFGKSLSSLRGGVSGVTAALGPAGLAVGAFLGSFSTTVMSAASKALETFRTNLEKIDEIGKKSASIGISGQDLRRLQYAAELSSGVDPEKTSKSLQFMVDAISNAASGLGEGQAALEQLGLDAEKLNQKNPMEQFLMISEALGDIENKNDQLKISRDLLGRGGTDLVTTLREGPRAIKAMSEEFDTFAGKLSELDISKIEQLNDQLNKTGKAFQGAGEQLTAEFTTPALAVVKELNEKIAQAQGIGEDEPRGRVGTISAQAAQSGAGLSLRGVVQSFAGGGGASNAITVLVNTLLNQIPSVISLVEKHQTQDMEAASAIVNAVNRVEVATRDSAVAIESPPGSR